MMGLTLDQSCDCGADFQTMEHVTYYCPFDFSEGEYHISTVLVKQGSNGFGYKT